MAYDWPGNARELRNALERATVVCSGGMIELTIFRLTQHQRSTPVIATELKSVERSMIERVMNDMQGNISKAARTLGISRTQLYRRLRKHGLRHVVSWKLDLKVLTRVDRADTSQRASISGQ